jgi:uncharacterized protein YbaR (Trm112 family)
VHIEFIDLLRCPNPHEESWLVAAFSRMDGRDVLEAKLGCPVCNGEYFIRDGIAHFGDGVTGARPAGDDPAHIAAFLNLTSPGKTILLAGAYAECAAAVSTIAEARVVSLNAARSVSLDQVAELRVGDRIPLASNSLDGIALDEPHATQVSIAEAERLLRPGGRLLIAVSATLPVNTHELARDSNHIVAEKISEFVSLGRKS